MPTDDHEEVLATQAAQHRRVLFSLMSIIARLSHLFGVRLKETGQLLETACFHYLRARGYRLDDLASTLDISPRKASMLSRQLKDGFFRAEREQGLPRRVEFLLWTEPMSAARITQLMREEVSEAEVQEALDDLMEQGRIRLAEGHHVTTYTLNKSASRMVRDAFDVKIDGLNHYASQVANVTAGRFEFDDPRTFARTVTLRVLPEDFDTLQALYQETMWPELVALDERAARAQEESGAEPIPVDLSISWTPYGLIDSHTSHEP